MRDFGNLYTNSGQPFIMKNGSYLDSGKRGSAYRFTDQGVDKVAKILDESLDNRQRKVVSYIQNLDLPNFYHIYDVLSSGRFVHKKFAGTVSKFYPKGSQDLLTVPSGYCLDNFSSLCKSFAVLSDHGILSEDLHAENVILGPSEMTVIDVDYYLQVPKLNSNFLLSMNIRNLKVNVFLDCFVRSYLRYHNQEMNISMSTLHNILNEMIGIDPCNIGEKENFAKNLSLYPYPIDYIKKQLS